MNKKVSWHIPALIVLLIIFIGLMVMSVGTMNTSVKYTYKNEALSYDVSGYDTNLVLGDVKVSNSRFLPAKIKLDTLIMCDMSNVDAFPFTVDYRGSTNQYDNVFYSYGNSYAELDAGEERTFTMVAYYSYYPQKEAGERLPKPKALHVFKVEDQANIYASQCRDLNTADAIAVFNLVYVNGTEQ